MKNAKKGAALGYVLVTGLLLILLAAVMVSTVGGVTKASLHSADKKLSYIDVKSSIEYAKAVINARLDANSAKLETNFYVSGSLSGGVLSFSHEEGVAADGEEGVYARAEFENDILSINASGSRLSYWDESMNVQYEYKLGPGSVLKEIPVGYAQVSREIGGNDIMRQSNTNNVMPVIFKYTLNLNFGNYTFNVLKTYFMGDTEGNNAAAPTALISNNSYTINSNVLYFRGELQQKNSGYSLNVGRFSSSYTPSTYPIGQTLYFYFDNTRIVYSDGTKSPLLHGVYSYTLGSSGSTVNMYGSGFVSALTLLGVPVPAVRPVDPGLTEPVHPGYVEPTHPGSAPATVSKPSGLSSTYYPTQKSGESNDNFLARLNRFKNNEITHNEKSNGYYYSKSTKPLTASRQTTFNNYLTNFTSYVNYTIAKTAYDSALNQYNTDLAAYNANMAPYWTAKAQYDAVMNQYYTEVSQYQTNLNAYNSTNQTTLNVGLKHFDSHVIESRSDIRHRWISAEDAGWLTNGLISTSSPAAKPDNYISMYLIGLNNSSNYNTFQNRPSLHYQAKTIRLRTYLDAGGTSEYDVLVGNYTGMVTNNASTPEHWYYSGGGGTGRYIFGINREWYTPWFGSSYWKYSSTAQFNPVTLKFTTQFLCFENYDRILQMNPGSSFIISPAIEGNSIYIQFNQTTWIYLSNGSIKTVTAGVYVIEGEVDLFDATLHDSDRFRRVADITSAEVITPGLIPTVSIEDGRYVR